MSIDVTAFWWSRIQAQGTRGTSDSESWREALASTDMSGPLSATAPSSRAVGNVHLCIFLILGLGFVLIFSYQSEIHRVVTGEGRTHRYRPLVASRRGNSRPVIKHILKPGQHSNAPVDSKAGEKGQLGSLSSEKLGIKSTLPHKTSPGASRTPSNSRTEKACRPLSKRKNRREHEIEAYKPLVSSVQSNVVSSKFRFVIKVLALNDYPSFVRCLGSLAEAEYTGDVVDIHIYVDHFELREAATSQRRRLSSVQEGTEKNSSIATSRRESGQGHIPDQIERMVDSEKLSERKIAHEGMDINESKATSGNKFRQPHVPDQIERMVDMGESRDCGSAQECMETDRSRATSGSESGQAHLPDRIERVVDSVESSDWGMEELKLWDARKVLDYAESFVWKHGKKIIHYNSRAGGSQRQWLDAWWPSSDDEFALFVEDDMELSPLYYRYARALIATYHYEPSHFDSSLYGISLQRAQIVPGKNGKPLKVDNRTRLFKYQMVGISGQIFFPKPWKEFREWYDSKKSRDLKPTRDGMVTTDWYRKDGEKIFTPWFVKFAYNREYFNLHTNFLRDRGLSVIHRNVSEKSKRYAGCDSDLLGQTGTYDIDVWHMAAPWYIKRYDYCFRKVQEGRFAKYASDRARVLKLVSQGKEQILMVSTVGIPEILVKNWLCKMRELGIENYILFGEQSEFLEEMARRGHAAMRIESTHNFEEYFEKEAAAVSDVLQLGYAVWFTRADTIWLRNAMEVADIDGADIVGVENSELNLFFIRSTKDTILFWDSLLEELVRTVYTAARSELARKKVIENFKEQGILRIRNLQQKILVDGDNLYYPSTLDATADAQVLVFSDLKLSSDNEVQAKLGRLELWNLDDDLACARLIC